MTAVDGAPRAASAPSLRVRLAIALGARVLRLLSRTWRFREVGREGWRRVRAAGRPAVLALWHGEMLSLLAHHRDEGVAVLISEHRDGEIIARVARALGFRTVRGSTSRGGSRALLELAAELRRGGEVAVTPDGPRGPRHAFAPGALVAAQRGGAPVIGVVTHVDRVWRLRSWDAFEIPKPFARVTVVYSEPQEVGGASARDAAAEAPRFERLMHDLAATAARASGA